MINPDNMAVMPKKRICLSESKHQCQPGKPVSQHINNPAYLPALLEFLRYLKNAELGSTTMTSLFLLKLAL